MKSHKFSRVVLLTLIFQSVLATLSVVLDKTLQQFRRRILEFQRTSLIQIDESFFEFYDLLFTKLNSSLIQPHIQLKDEFNSSCANFPIYTLEPLAARRFINICDDIQRVISRLLRTCDNILEKYYQHVETFDTESVYELVAEDYFEDSAKYFDLIVPIYNQNPKCVKPLLNRFHDIYRKPIDVILKSSRGLTRMVKKGVERDFKFISHSTNKLFGVVLKTTRCSNESVIDTFGCVSDFVGYDCFKKKSGCGIFYKSIYIILDHVKRIESYYNYYDDSFTLIFNSIQVTEQQLVNWLDSADFCVIQEM